MKIRAARVSTHLEYILNCTGLSQIFASLNHSSGVNTFLPAKSQRKAIWVMACQAGLLWPLLLLLIFCQSYPEMALYKLVRLLAVTNKWTSSSNILPGFFPWRRPKNKCTQQKIYTFMWTQNRHLAPTDIHCIQKKNIPNIINCHLKKG